MAHPIPDALLVRIDRLVSQLSTRVIVDTPTAAQLRASLEEIELQMRAAGAPDALVAMTERIAAQVGVMDPSELVASLVDAWERWRDGADLAVAEATAGPAAAIAPSSDPASAAAAAETDAELAALIADPELAGMFVVEALDHLSSIESCALQLEATPEDTRILNDVFRPFHTVKGNAGALGVTSVQELAHKLENLLDLARSGRYRIGARGIDLVLRAVDVLASMLRDVAARLKGEPGRDFTADRRTLMQAVDDLIANGEPAVPAAADPADAAAEPPAARESERPLRTRHDDAGQMSVKVDTRKLDNLIDMVGELVIVQSIINEDPALARVLDDRLTRNLAQLKRITTDLQRNAMSLRMLPIRQTFQKMARLVRDLSRKSGKTVDLVMSGEDTELDRRVVEDINDPLMHMVRNSIDHGLEKAEARLAAGKPAAGRLSLSAYHEGGSIVIAIADDGAGLNTDRIRAKAIAQGLIQPADPLTPAEIHQLIFRPGFSTAEQVTEISGRGVGMDVVRRNIEALRGRIDIHSAPGEGTTFLIRLPLTLAIVDGLMLGVGEERFVLPTFSVRESLRPEPGQVHRVHGEPRMVQVRETLLPLVSLGELFGVRGAQADPAAATVVVMENGGRRMALLVDALLGKQEVVIKSLGAAFQQVRGVAGGAILGDGRIGLILDAQGLFDLKDGARAAA